jgi:AraC-like DNA-binding protein
MRLRREPANSRGAVTHWQASGHARVRHLLSTIHPRTTEFEFESDDSDTHLECSVVDLAGLKLLRTDTSGYQCRGSPGPTDALRVTLPARGGVEVIAGRSETVALAGTSGVACLHDGVDRRVHSGYLGFHLRIPRRELLSAVRTLAGEQFAADGIESSIDLRTPIGASLLGSVGTLFNEVERLATMGLGQLACASTNELVVNLAAVAVLPRLRDRMGLPQVWVGRSTVETARQFIEAHAVEPIRLGDLANRLGVTLRALQVGFKKQFGSTLSEYLFRRRLEIARARLATATDAMTVTAVALDCGFVNSGAFADRYRRAFGELPSQTLKNAARGMPQPSP